MNEQEWLTSTDPARMVDFACGYRDHRDHRDRQHFGFPMSDRKLRIYACALCRNVWDRMDDARSRHAVEVAERYADGLATKEEMDDAYRHAGNAVDWHRWDARDLAASASRIHRTLTEIGWVCDTYHANMPATPVQADLLRHIIGNPFGPDPINFTPDSWFELTGPKRVELSPPKIIRDLAAALYDGHADAAFGLHDALLDSGAAELADHFRSEGKCGRCQGSGKRKTYESYLDDGCPTCRGTGKTGYSSHPKGCWALDLILGKE